MLHEYHVDKDYTESIDGSDRDGPIDVSEPIDVSDIYGPMDDGRGGWVLRATAEEVGIAAAAVANARREEFEILRHPVKVTFLREQRALARVKRLEKTQTEAIAMREEEEAMKRSEQAKRQREGDEEASIPGPIATSLAVMIIVMFIALCTTYIIGALGDVALIKHANKTVIGFTVFPIIGNISVIGDTYVWAQDYDMMMVIRAICEKIHKPHCL